MLFQSQLLLYLVLSICEPIMSLKRENPLSGKTLRISFLEFGKAAIFKRNASNHIVGFDGVLVHHVEALAKMLNFSYVVASANPPQMKSRPLRWPEDALHYILNGDADYTAGAIAPTVPRLKLADFPASWTEAFLNCIVPYPKHKIDAIASVKPFVFEVWVLISASAITTILCLHFLLNKQFTFGQSLNPVIITDNSFGSGINNFVWGNLVSQGQSLSSSRLAVRFLAGSWCLVCFFLVQSYCSTLTSHLTSSNQKPIANSIHQLASLPDISIAVDKGLGLNYVLMAAESGNLKLLGNKLRKNSNLLCSLTTDCLETVQRDGYTAYCNEDGILQTIITEDFKEKGTCQYYLINEILMSTSLYNVLPKNSPYTEMFSRSILRLKESGLVFKWFSLYTSRTWQCKLNNGVKNNLERLSMRHLSSAFVILLCGLVFSSIVFSFEKFTLLLGSRAI